MVVPSDVFTLILAPIIDPVNTRGALLIQKEMNELGLQLHQTTAGRMLCCELGELVMRYQKFMERLRSKLKDPTLDPEQLEVMMNDYKELSEQLQRATEELKKNKFSVGDWIQRTAKRVDSWIFGTVVPNVPSNLQEPSTMPGSEIAADSDASTITSGQENDCAAPPSSPADNLAFDRTNRRALHGSVTVLSIIHQLVGSSPIPGLRSVVAMILNL